MGYNMFAYCGNSPIVFVDPSGSIAVIDDALLLAGTLIVVFPTLILLITPPPIVVDAFVDATNQIVNNIFAVIEEGIQILTVKPNGKNRMRDSGLAHLSDEEITERSKDKNLSPQERQRYRREEKARGNRNKHKRQELY